MKRAWLLAIALAGCDPGDPNGMDRVLWFNSYGYRAPVGSTVVVGILHHKKLSGGIQSLGKGLAWYRSETFDYDFAGTSLEVQPTEAGITVLSTALTNGDWLATLRCDAPTNQVVAFRVTAGALPRYADRTRVECTAPQP